MLVINNIPILVPVQTIVAELNTQLKIQGKSYLTNMKQNSSNILCSCPFHGEDKHPSFSILIRERNGVPEGTYNCLACKRHGSLSKLISALLYDREDDMGTYGDRYILDNYADYELDNRETVFKLPNRKNNTELATYISEEELDSYAFYHPYMYKRYLTNDIIDEFDIGYDKDFKLSNGHITPCLTFPVRDLTGGTRFIARRSIDGKMYNYPVNINKSDFLYGLYESNKIFGDYPCLYVCESMFNALTLIQWGKPAVALLGTGCNNQYELLKKVNARQLVICLDNDSSGIRGTEKLKEALQTYKIIHVMKICEEKTDINDLGYLDNYEEFERRCEIA